VSRTGDEVLVQRAARRIAWQVTVVVGAAMLVLLAVVTVAVVRQQQHETDRELRATAAAADDVQDPPVGSWIVLVRDRRTDATSGLPVGIDDDLRRARAGLDVGDSRLSTVHVSDTPYRVLSQRGDDGVVQVVADLGPQHEARERLLRISVLAVAGSLIVAAGLGVALAGRAVQPLALALALQRRFVADASHELRTPLTLLTTRAQVLLRSLQRREAEGEVIADATGVVEDAQRLGEVVEDLLVAATPLADEVRKDVDLGRLLAEVVASAQDHATSGDVRLVLEADAGAVVVGARPALRRAVLNLVDNAIDHTPPGGEVRVELRASRSEVVVTVADTGPGITPGQEAEVMRRFRSGGQRSGRAHYGLGLALTQDVADRHGGRLRIAPSERGAAFELVLPPRNA
jgi:signal transduction histidine kinase